MLLAEPENAQISDACQDTTQTDAAEKNKGTDQAKSGLIDAERVRQSIAEIRQRDREGESEHDLAQSVALGS